MNTSLTSNNASAITSSQVIPGPICKDISAEAFMSFLSSLSTNVGRATFYNLKEEQRQAMIDQHQIIFERARPLYALLMLPEGVNDVNKALILYNLVTHTYRDPEIKDHEHDPLTKWENELGLYILKTMPPPRVFDFFEMMVEQKITKKRLFYLFHEYLFQNIRSWPLWALKYRKPFTKALRHFHTGKRRQNFRIANLWRYLKYNETSTNTPDLIKDYKRTQEGDIDALWKLPLTVAEGFREKFNLSMEDFTKKFTKKGFLTQKEKRIRVASVQKATDNKADTGFDIRKANLFDSLVFLSSGAKLRMQERTIKQILNEKAKAIADRLPFNFNNTVVIFDNSISMIGTDDQKLHPLLRGVAISFIIQNAGTGNAEFRINSGNGIIPHIGNQSNYADVLVSALAMESFENVVIIGDGYENSPFQGAAHQVIYTFKKKIDTENKVSFFHFNPVFAAESKDVREISELAPAVGVRDVEAFPETMFIAMGKSRPAVAALVYLNNLIEKQPARAKELMPEIVKKALITDSNKLLV